MADRRDMTFGEKLIMYRTFSKTKQSQLSEWMGVSVPTIRAIERGEDSKVDLSGLQNLEKHTGIPVATWVTSSIPFPDLSSQPKTAGRPTAEKSDLVFKEQAGRKKRIKQVIDEMFSGSKEEFAQVVGQQPSAISHYLGKRNITDAFLLKVSRNVAVSKRWLMTGEGEMFSNDPAWMGTKPTERHEGEMLKSYILSNGISARALGLMMGLKESSASKTVIQYFGSKQLSLEVKEKALNALQAREEEVFPIHTNTTNSKNDMTATLTKHTGGSIIYPIGIDEEYIEIPFVPQKARAGLDVARYWEEPVETVRIRRALLPTDKKQWWIIEVNGDSMGEKLSTGTRVLAYWVPRDDWRLAPSRVWAVQYGDEFVIKRVRQNQIDEKKGVMLHSDNPPPDPFFVKVEDIRHIWIIRKIIESEVY